MPKLKNQRRERFAQGVFRGLPLNEAYRRAGYKGKANSIATFLVREPDVQARIADLNAKVERASILTKQQALVMLSKGAAAAFRFMQTAGTFGTRVIGMDPAIIDANPELKLAIREAVLAKDGTTTLKLHDYREALALLARLEGWEAPRDLNLHSKKSLAEMTDDEILGLIGGELEAGHKA